MAGKTVTKKTKPVEKVEAPQTPKAPTYPKDVLMRAEKWADRRDLLDAILDIGKVYTIDEVDHMINEYFNKEV